MQPHATPRVRAGAEGQAALLLVRELASAGVKVVAGTQRQEAERRLAAPARAHVANVLGPCQPRGRAQRRPCSVPPGPARSPAASRARPFAVRPDPRAYADASTPLPSP